MDFTTIAFAFAVFTANLFVDAQKQVPAIFFFGDSQYDNGNNNPLITLAKVNYQPYGIDYPAGPTGRFSNGRNVPDYLAQNLGFPVPISPYVATSDSSIKNGVNYASGGAGILDSTGANLGVRFTMNTQLRNHVTIINRIARLNRSTVSTVRNNYLTKCLYVVDIVNNDYLNNYLLPYNILLRAIYSPDAFARLLIQRLSEQLRTLYNQGARKVAVFGAGLLGCVPQQIQAANAQGCVDSVNNIVKPFNARMKPMIDTLNQLPSAQFTYINTTNIALGDPSLSGIKFTTTPCCNVVPTTGLCIRNSVPCSNRSEYSFWDNYHVTSDVSRATAARAYVAAQREDSYPFDIRSLLVQQ